MACRIYFCPSHRVLPQRFKIVARAAIDNWCTYGLIITECNLINACFKEIDYRPSRYHEILYALGSVFSCRQSMQRAEEILNAHFVDITEAILEL